MRCLAFLATAQMASCLFPPNLSDGPTNLPLAEDIEKNPTVFGELLRGEAPIRKPVSYTHLTLPTKRIV